MPDQTDASEVTVPAVGHVLLTVLVPCFNEASIVAQTISNLRDYLERDEWRNGLMGEWELVFVDDGSTDETRHLLKEAALADARVRYISYCLNRGQGEALQRGFGAARGELIFCVDADLDYAPDHIERFIASYLRHEVDIIVGSAYMRGGSTRRVPVIRYLMSRAMNWYFSRVLRLGFSTYTSIVRLYRREALRRLILTSRDKDILPEILIKSDILGISILEVPAHLEWHRIATRSAAPRGVSIRSTASKAVRHLVWGAIENPFLFFLTPASLVGVGAIWFGIALTKLFVVSYSRSSGSGLASITEAANALTVNNPQTIAMFAILLQASLVMLGIGIVILQNKIKKEQDLIVLSRFQSMLQAPSSRIEE